MRRGIGVGAINNAQLQKARFQDRGNDLAKEQLEKLVNNADLFKKNLEQYAAQHKDKIRKNAHLRARFAAMCGAIGVDPLASSRTFWSETLGIGNFYYEVAVKLVEVALANAPRTGGLMELGELRRRLAAAQTAHERFELTDEDLIRAIRALHVLGKGFELIGPLANGRYLVQCVPAELSADHTAVLQCATSCTAYVPSAFLKGDTTRRPASSADSERPECGAACSVDDLRSTLGWSAERASLALERLASDGIAWLDSQSQPNLYWIPSLWIASASAAR